MDLSDMFLSHLGLAGGLRKIFNLSLGLSLPPDHPLCPDKPEDLAKEQLNLLVEKLPDLVLEKIFRKYIGLHPIRTFFQLNCVTVSKLLEDCPNGLIPESWMLNPNFVLLRRGQRNLDTYDVQQKTRVPLKIPLGCNGRLGLISSDDLRVSSNHGGECGLIYLQKSGAQTSTIEWFVCNPMIQSVRQLPLPYVGIEHFFSLIDRFSSGYLSWASDGDEKMFPLLFDPVTGTWERIGADFLTRGHLRMEKAIKNEIIYLRYKEYKDDFKHRVIKYDIHKRKIDEVETTGLPDKMINEHLFHYEGHIYLAAVLLSFGVEKGVALYELNSTTLNWMKIGEMPRPLLGELTPPYPAVSRLKFLYTHCELLVIPLVSERRGDGARVYLDGTRPSRTIATYDVVAGLWRKDDSSRLGPNFDVHSTVYRPRLDIEA